MNNKRTILLVEDEAIIALSQKMTLEKYGYKVITVNSGETAIEIFKTGNPVDLILMDIDLGSGLDGPSAAKIILEEKEIPVVFLSSHTEPEVVEKTEKITSYGYVVKNSGITVLDASIKMAFKLFYAKINELKKERALRESEEKYRLLHENAGIGIGYYKTDGTVISFNNIAAKLMNGSPEDFTGKSIYELYPEKDAKLYHDRIKKSMISDNPIIYEDRVSLPEGNLYFLSTFTRISDLKGKILGIQIISQDITERIQTEARIKEKNEELGVLNEELTATVEEFESAHDELIASNDDLYQTQVKLLESEKKYRSLFENSGAGIVIIDKAGIYKMVNNIAAKRMGGTPEDFTGRSMKDLLPPEIADNYLKANAQIMETGTGRSYESSFTLNGQHYSFHITDEPLRDYKGEVYAIQSCSVDITARKQIEDLLRKSEQKFRWMYESNLIGIAFWNVEGFFTEANTAFCRMLDVTSEEISTGKVSWQSATPPEILHRDMAAIEEIRLNGFNLPYEKEFVLPDGRRIPVMISGHMLPDSDTIGVAYAVDLSERKRTENVLKFYSVRQQVLLQLHNMMDTPVNELFDFVLKSNIQLTHSRFSIIGTLDDTESVITIYTGSEEDNRSGTEPVTLKISESGFIGECIRQRKPLIINSSEDNYNKNDYLSTLINIESFLAVPVFDGQKIAAVAAVANKTGVFDETDCMSLTLLSERLWGITRRKRAETRLLENETKLRILIEQLPVGISVLNTENQIVYMNPALGRILDISHERLLRGDYKDRKYLREDGSTMPAEEFASTRAISEKKDIYNVITGVVKEDGTTTWNIVSAILTNIYNWEVILITIDITERKKSEEQVKNLLVEKNIILKEVHHRIKNNMNIVKGLLFLQADISDNPEAGSILRDTENRLSSMMVLYDKLYLSSNFDNVSFKEYFTSLIDEIIVNFHDYGTVKIKKNIEDFDLDEKVLSYLGIILNELLTNIMKYAFTVKKSLSVREITVSAIQKDNRITIIIADNGIGIPESVTFENSTGFGMTMVKMLSEQIGAVIRIEHGDGGKFIMEFDKQ